MVTCTESGVQLVSPAQEPVLPADRRVQFNVTAPDADVLHSFWIPAFRLKADAVPGHTATIYLTPTARERPTTWRIACSAPNSAAWGTPPCQALGLGITSLLLLSSLTAYRAETAIAHGNLAYGRTMLLATIALGLVFMGGVAIEWSIAEFTPSDGFGTAFFTMTGMHVSHVASGVLLLVLVYRLAGNGRFTPDGH